MTSEANKGIPLFTAYMYENKDRVIEALRIAAGTPKTHSYLFSLKDSEFSQGGQDKDNYCFCAEGKMISAVGATVNLPDELMEISLSQSDILFLESKYKISNRKVGESIQDFNYGTLGHDYDTYDEYYEQYIEGIQYKNSFENSSSIELIPRIYTDRLNQETLVDLKRQYKSGTRQVISVALLNDSGVSWSLIADCIEQSWKPEEYLK